MSLQPQILSVLADMLKKSVEVGELVRSWKSSWSERTALQVLLNLWREAESDWGVCTDGVLSSVRKPLAGIGRRNLWIPKHEVCNEARLYDSKKSATVGYGGNLLQVVSKRLVSTGGVWLPEH
jgi:hypothetical protein